MPNPSVVRAPSPANSANRFSVVNTWVATSSTGTCRSEVADERWMGRHLPAQASIWEHPAVLVHPPGRPGRDQSACAES